MCVYVFDKASLHQAFVQVALLLVAFFCVYFVFQKAFFAQENTMTITINTINPIRGPRQQPIRA